MMNQHERLEVLFPEVKALAEKETSETVRQAWIMVFWFFVILGVVLAFTWLARIVTGIL